MEKTKSKIQDPKEDIAILTQEPIALASVLQVLVPIPHCGSRVWFEGIVRNRNEGQEVSGIFYEAYGAMAQQELEKIKQQTKQKWPLAHLTIIHRVGKLKVGETSLIVVAQSAHRQEGFEAVQYVIDQIKKKVPIWKKEIYEQGKEKWL